jgi:hypothetical protein
LRAPESVANLSRMSDERPPGSQNPETPADPDAPAQGRRSASQDLAEGLELMLRAARKAVKSVDPGKIESLGRRAVGHLENLDRKRVGELGKKAARNLDPRRIEEIAEEAGRELLNVVERVAERVESAVSGTRGESSAPTTPDKPPEPGDERPRVRIDER